VTAPSLAVLVRCEGLEEVNRLVRGLTFRGLTFTQTAQIPLPLRDPKDTGTLDTNDCAILLQGAAACTIEDCRFVQAGGYGVRLRHAARGNRIINNEFAACGGGGVLLTGYGPGTRDFNRGNVIAGNHVHHCGVFFGHATAISLTQSGENVLAFNDIHDMPYGGIMVADCSVDYFKEFRGKQGRGFQFRWEEIGDDPLTFESVKRFTHSRKNQIAYNTIHHVMQWLHDGGGIHLGFVGGQNVVRGNLIYSVRGTGSAWGLYMDAETNREQVEGNVVWDCNAPKIDNEYGGPSNNQWVKNVLSIAEGEPPEAKALRGTIAAKRKKGLSSPDVAP
jgi:parallel beta-helix repeat protein